MAMPNHATRLLIFVFILPLFCGKSNPPYFPQFNLYIFCKTLYKLALLCFDFLCVYWVYLFCMECIYAKRTNTEFNDSYALNTEPVNNRLDLFKAFCAEFTHLDLPPLACPFLNISLLLPALLCASSISRMY